MKPKQKNVLILIVVVILLVALFYFFGPAGGPQDEMSNEDQADLQELESDLESIELEDFEEEFAPAEEDIEQL